MLLVCGVRDLLLCFKHKFELSRKSRIIGTLYNKKFLKVKTFFS